MEREIVMRLSLILLALFFASFALQSQSRELSYKEKSLLISQHKTTSVKDFMIKNLEEADLPLRDFIILKILKKSCSPLGLLLEKIKGEKSDFPDQTEKLAPLVLTCAKGTIGLTSLYIQQGNTLD